MLVSGRVSPFHFAKPLRPYAEKFQPQKVSWPNATYDLAKTRGKSQQNFHGRFDKCQGKFNIWNFPLKIHFVRKEEHSSLKNPTWDSGWLTGLVHKHLLQYCKLLRWDLTSQHLCRAWDDDRLVGEHHVKMDDFRWIWICLLYWIQLCPWTVSLVEGFSRSREVVKPRRKAKNLVFGHPWHPPISTTFVVYLSSGYRKLKVSLEVYKQWGEANINLQPCNSNLAFCEISQKKSSCMSLLAHRNAGKPPWVFEFMIQISLGDPTGLGQQRQGLGLKNGGWSVVTMLLLGLKWRV